MKEPSPKLRLVLFLLAVTGAFIGSSVIVLGVGWAFLVIPLVLATRISKAHGRFLLVVVLPICIMLFAVWGWLVGAPPGEPHDSNQVGGIEFAATTTLRLVLLGGFAQLLLLTIPNSDLTSTLRGWGLRGDLLLAGLATFVFFPELRVRADQILTARMARGLVPNMRLWTRIRQIAPSLGLLFTLAVRAAVNRADHWAEQRLFDEPMTLALEDGERYRIGAISIVLSLFVVAWVVLCVFTRFFAS